MKKGTIKILILAVLSIIIINVMTTREVEASTEEYIVNVGEEAFLPIEFTGVKTFNQTCRWSSNSDCVEIGATHILPMGEWTLLDCYVKGVRAGTATITAKYSLTYFDNWNYRTFSSTKAFTVTVKDKVVSISSINTTKSKTLNMKETFTIVPTINPVDATNKTLSYRSSKPDVATVDNNGVVTARKAGSTVITITTTDGSNLTTKCTITVKPAVPKSVKAIKKTKTSTQITWKKVTGATGYEIYRSTNKSKGYKCIATIKDVKKVSYINKKLAKKGTYYYKVRSYKTINGKKVYSNYSNYIKVKL